VTGQKMDADDLIRITAPSGGGYGDPTKRDAEAVLGDWLDDYITAAMARDVYRVAIDEAGEAVDTEETKRLRGS
jgi:N-methylhydantoinase B/oxoprolinase/acetone carboxylase alpha subunit